VVNVFTSNAGGSKSGLYGGSALDPIPLTSQDAFIFCKNTSATNPIYFNLVFGLSL